MEKSFFRRAAWETVRTALVYTAYCLFAMAIFAVIVRACAPGDGVITGVNWGIKCVGALVCGLLLIRKERALFKGAAAGLLGVILTTFAFAAIGGGFHVTALYPVELLVCAVLCGLGALLGGKLRKE